MADEVTPTKEGGECEISLPQALELLSQLASMDSAEYKSALVGGSNKSALDSSDSTTPVKNFEKLYQISNSSIWALTSAVHRLQSNRANLQAESDQQATEIALLKDHLEEERQRSRALEASVHELTHRTQRIDGKFKKAKSEKKRLVVLVQNFWAKLQDSEQHSKELEELKVAYRLQAHENTLMLHSGRDRTQSTDTMSSEALTLEFMPDDTDNQDNQDNQSVQSMSAQSTCSSLVTDEGVATVRLAPTSMDSHVNPSFSVVRNRTFSDESELSLEPMSKFSLASPRPPEMYTLTFRRGQKVGLQIRAIPMVMDEPPPQPHLAENLSTISSSSNSRPRSHPSLMEAFAETRDEVLEEEGLPNNNNLTGSESVAVKTKSMQQQQPQQNNSQNPFRHFSVNNLNPFAGMMGSNNNAGTGGSGSSTEMDDSLTKKAAISAPPTKVNNLNPFAGMMGSNNNNNAAVAGGGVISAEMDDSLQKKAPRPPSPPKLQVFLVCGYSDFDDESNARPPIGSRIVAVNDTPILDTFTMKGLMALLSSFSQEEHPPQHPDTTNGTTREEAPPVTTTYTVSFRNEPLSSRQRELLEKPSSLPDVSALSPAAAAPASSNDGGSGIIQTTATVKSDVSKQPGLNFNFLPAGMLSPLNMNRPVPPQPPKSNEQLKPVAGSDKWAGADVTPDGEVEGSSSGPKRGTVFFMSMPNTKNKDVARTKQRKNLGERFAHSMGLGSGGTTREQSPMPGEDVVDL